MGKLRSSICFSCCVRSTDADPLAHGLHHRSAASTWINSADHHIPDVKDRRCGFTIKIGKSNRRRQSASFFRYDPLSYALNFDDGNGLDEAGGIECRYRNFMARLPASPSPPAVAPSPPVPSEEEVAVSCS